MIPEAVVMPFGKYKGHTLGEIADEDLLYLDWLNDPAKDIRSQQLVLGIAEICAKWSAKIESMLEDLD